MYPAGGLLSSTASPSMENYCGDDEESDFEEKGHPHDDCYCSRVECDAVVDIDDEVSVGISI